MDISAFTVRIIFLLFPGILATTIFKSLSAKSKMDNRDFAINVILFAGASYLLAYLIGNKTSTSFVTALLSSDTSINVSDVLWASIIAVALGLLWTIISNKSWLYNIANECGISSNTGYDSVWDEMMDGDSRGTSDFAYVVYPDEDLVYGGRISNFSVKKDKKELVLDGVRVFKNSNRKKELRTMKKVYLEISDSTNVIVEMDDGENK